MGLEQKAIESFVFGDNPFEIDHPQDECGILGVYMPEVPEEDTEGVDIGNVTFGALKRLQHRGQSGAGIAYSLGGELIVHRGNGRIDEAIPEVSPQFSPHGLITLRHSRATIGHTRYSTDENNYASQPLLDFNRRIAVAHNGHVELAHQIGELFFGVEEGKAVSDSDAIKEMISNELDTTGDLLEAIHEVLPRLEGAYCLTITDGERLIAARDPWGTHPLSLAELKNGQGYIVASETAAFKFVETESVRDIDPGEVVLIDENGVHSSSLSRVERRQECMYEYFYIARPISEVNGANVYAVRKALGKYLAMDHGVDADVVVGVPNSGMAAAGGFAEQSGIPRVDGLIKDDYVGRAFIEREAKRLGLLNEKFDVNEVEVAGKRVVLVDDSVIKGDTMKTIVGMIRDAGASEVHVRSAAPKYLNPCYGGMDTRDRSRHIAAHFDDQGIANEIGANSIRYNTLERAKAAIKEGRIHSLSGDVELCDGCYTGNYPYIVDAEELDLVVSAESDKELALYQG